MTYMHECLVMPPISPISLPPPTQLCHSRTGLASEPLRPPEAKDGLVPFPCSDERMTTSGGAPHKDDSAQRQPPQGARPRRRTVRRKKSSLGLREDFLKSSETEGTSPTTESPESSPVEPQPQPQPSQS